MLIALRSPKTPLAKQNGGIYDFIIEDKMALPIDPVRIFYQIAHDL